MNMSVNTSQNASSTSSPNPFNDGCFGSPIFTGFTVTNLLLLLPLSVSILCFGFQRRRGTMNPIDVFTYHMVAMEMIGICGSVVCCCGAFTHRGSAMMAGCNSFAIISCVKMFFHVLTCVERYVAVVHPIAYLGLNKTSGAMMRNISIGCVWAVCSGLIALRLLIRRNFIMILFFCNLALSLIVSSFCSLSVLCVLIRTRPGEKGGNKGRTDALKQKAFVTVTAIMAVLLLRFCGNLVCLALASSSVLSSSSRCVVQISGIWFCLPSSYVLPLLFLHRAEKLPCFEYNKK